MKVESITLIPDVDPSGGILSIDPLIYGGGRLMWRKPNAIAVIRKNAGSMTVEELADAMGLSESRLRRIARNERIDLTCRRKEPEPRGA